MKKNILFTMLLVLVAFGVTSCSNEESEGLSRITYYVDFQIQGGDFVIVPIGTPYTDAGCKATINGQDATSRIIATGIDQIDVNLPGFYTVTYSATNDDGYTTSASRTVAVCDPSITTDISGTWTLQEGSYRFYEGKSPYSDFIVRIRKDAPGIFYVSDFLAGWYDQGAGYGSDYACTGYIQLLADGTLKCLSSYVVGWGDSLEDFEGQYDAATNSIVWDATYTDYPFVFHAILNK